jgi:hypothetical protein
VPKIRIAVNCPSAGCYHNDVTFKISRTVIVQNSILCIKNQLARNNSQRDIELRTVLRRWKSVARDQIPLQSIFSVDYRPISHDVTAPVMMHLEVKLQSMHNITFVNKANFLKVYNNFVLKWLIFALYVVVVPEQILLRSIWILEDTPRTRPQSSLKVLEIKTKAKQSKLN